MEVTKRYLLVAVGVGVASAVCLVVQAVLLGVIIQRVVLGHSGAGPLSPFLAGLAAAFAARAALAWVGELAAHRTSATVTSVLRRQLLARAVALGPSWLAGERTGELTASATTGVDTLDLYFSRYLPAAVLAALAPVVLLGWVLWSDWQSFLILAVTVSVIPVFMVLLGLEARRQATRQWSKLSGLAATFYDLLRGLPTLRAFGRAKAGRQTLEKASEDFRVMTMSTLRVAFLSSVALEVLASVGTALVALWLGLRLLDGTMLLGTALAVLVLAPEVYLPLRRAGAEFHSSTEGQAAAERILDLLDETEPGGGAVAGGAVADAMTGVTSVTDAAGAAGDAGAADRDHHSVTLVPIRAAARQLPEVGRSAIGLSEVWVRYPGRVIPALAGVDLVVEPGEHVAVMGESGSGKSTLLSVLLGFVEPAGGSVTIGGVDLRDLSLREWRQHIAWVPQRPYLVRGTIADNLLLGRADAGGEALSEAVELSGLSGLLRRLPAGLDTPVGEGGLTLSAGERQRIALGRAVLRDAPVILLDEPTAHLDVDREASLREALEPWLEGRTVLVAAHRRGLVGRVDRILQMAEGQFVLPGEGVRLLRPIGLFS